MKEKTIPIDQAGRIVLPKGVREELALKAGDTFVISVCGMSITLTPKKEKSGFIRKDNVLVFTAGSTEPLSQETVSRLLQESRDEHAGKSLEGLQQKTRKK